MTPKQAWTDSHPRLAAGCVLGVLLAAGAGCVGEALELDDRPDSVDVNSDGVSYADAGSGPRSDAGAAPQPGYADAGSATVDDDCDPAEPYADGGAFPPAPYADAGSPHADAGSPRSCFSARIGDGKTCLSDVDLKREAEALCQQKGYQPDSIELGEGDCAGGSTQGWIACCESAAPTPAAGACTGGALGDGSTCMDLASLKEKASAACEAIGASLVGLAGGADPSCPDGALWAKYECCTGDEPPKPSGPGKELWPK